MKDYRFGTLQCFIPEIKKTFNLVLTYHNYSNWCSGLTSNGLAESGNSIFELQLNQQFNMTDDPIQLDIYSTIYNQLGINVVLLNINTQNFHLETKWAPHFTN